MSANPQTLHNAAPGYPLVINGRLVAGAMTLDVINPATGRLLTRCARADKAQLDAAVAAAKLNDAQTFEDARAWLTARERVAVLGDRALIAMLARLPSAADRPNAA